VRWSTAVPGRFTPGEEPRYPLYRRLESPGPVWTGVENIAITGVRTANNPARRQSLYRLSYADQKAEAFINFSPLTNDRRSLIAVCHKATSTVSFIAVCHKATSTVSFIAVCHKATSTVSFIAVCHKATSTVNKCTEYIGPTPM